MILDVEGAISEGLIMAVFPADIAPTSGVKASWKG